jgi:Tfp pilus assembly protein PilE
MGKSRENETGFSTIELILVLVIVALIGVVGYMVYKNHHKTTSATVATTASIKSATTTPAKTTPTTTTDPTAGWKTYSSNAVSFKYPANWIIGTDPNEGGGATVSSVANPIQLARPTQPARPQYNSNLALGIYTDTYNATYTGAGNIRKLDGSVILASDLTVNGSTYCLIGSNGTNTNNQTVINVSHCDSSAGTWQYEINGSNNTQLTLSIVSAGNGSSATVPINLSNSDLATIKLIVKSMKF